MARSTTQQRPGAGSSEAVTPSTASPEITPSTRDRFMPHTSSRQPSRSRSNGQLRKQVAAGALCRLEAARFERPLRAIQARGFGISTLGARALLAHTRVLLGQFAPDRLAVRSRTSLQGRGGLVRVHVGERTRQHERSPLVSPFGKAHVHAQRGAHVELGGASGAGTRSAREAPEAGFQEPGVHQLLEMEGGQRPAHAGGSGGPVAANGIGRVGDDLVEPPSDGVRENGQGLECLGQVRWDH